MSRTNQAAVFLAACLWVGASPSNIAAAAEAGKIYSAEELIQLYAPISSSGSAAESARGVGGIRQGLTVPAAATSDPQQTSAINIPSPAPRQGPARQAFHNILFGTNSYDIQAGSYAQLNEIGKALKTILDGDPSAIFVIEGHTDSRGSDQQNQALSYYRASAVQNYLVQRFEMDGRRVSEIGYGERRPVASNDSAYGQELNRRVEIVRN